MTTLLPHLSKAPKAAKLWTIAAAMFFLLEGVSSHTDFVARPKLLFKRGTATVIKVDADRVIIASDSRVTLPTGYRDDDCKIFALSHAVVFSGAGYRNISSAQPAGTWDSHDIARESFALTQSKHMDDVVSATAREWEAETLRFFAGPPDALQDLYDSGVHDIFDAIFVGGDSKNQLVAIHDNVRITPSESPVVKITSEVLHPPALLVVGVKDIAEEFANQTSPRALKEVAKWRDTVAKKDAADQEILFASQLVRWTILYGPENVGGDVDSVVVDSGGVHWINRKDVCKAEP